MLCKTRVADFTESVCWFEPGMTLYLGAEDTQF